MQTRGGHIFLLDTSLKCIHRTVAAHLEINAHVKRLSNTNKRNRNKVGELFSQITSLYLYVLSGVRIVFSESVVFHSVF